MLLKIKIILITILYIFGTLFMFLFPPRNFVASGAKNRPTRSVGKGFEFSHYLNSEQVFNIASYLAKDDPDVVRMVQLIPLTSENRTISAIEMKSDKKTIKPGILIVGALDGMVWGAPNAILELATKILYNTKYQTPFFNDYDWYLLPLGNPDGLEFTQNLRNKSVIDANIWNLNNTMDTQPSEWHKNVQWEQKDKACFGIDINRNFAYHWQDHLNKSPNPCSIHYAGYRPFSTPEARAIRAYVDSLGDVVQMAIHLHANFVPKKELILYPWRYSQRQHSNYQSMQAIGEYAARQSRLPDGRLYEVHQGNMEGRVAGTLIDYISGVVGIDLVYLIKPFHELRPNFTNNDLREVYVKKAINVILNLVRGWRSSTRQNTLTFFGEDIDF